VKVMARHVAAIVIALGVIIGVCSRQPAAAEDDQVDLLLVLAADISRSVDEKKFRLQRDGYAAAIVDPRVVRAMQAGAFGRIAICYMEWASDQDQKSPVTAPTIPVATSPWPAMPPSSAASSLTASSF
jgi:hypothetical protein